MVKIRNTSDKPVGIIGGQVCLPKERIVIKDKDALCMVFDEEGHATGEMQVLPGLKAMERLGLIEIDVIEDEEKPVEEPAKKPAKKKTTKKAAEVVEEETAE